MRTVWNLLLSILILLLLLSVERAAGLPFWSLAASGLFLSSLPLVQRGVGWFLVGSALAVVYSMPFVVGLVAVIVMMASVEVKVPYVTRESLKVWLMMIGVSSVLAVLIHFPWTVIAGVYHVGTAVGVLIFIRWWFAHRDRGVLK